MPGITTPQREFILLQDNREKKPLPWPSTISILSTQAEPFKQIPMRLSVVVKSVRLEAADLIADEHPSNIYLGVGASTSVIIERKYSLDELHTNVFNKTRRRNFRACLQRMRDGWDHPTLLLEGTLSRLYGKTHDAVEGGLVMDETLRLCYEHNVALQIVEGNSQGKRQLIAEHALRLLINGALKYHD